MLPDPNNELHTTELTQEDIDWLRSAKVEWDGCEAGAPIIEPARMEPFSSDGDEKLDALLAIFFLHARFEPGVYNLEGNKAFEVTSDHFKLLKVASWRGTAIDCKRPYGNFTNFTIDMARALGLPITAGADNIARISPQDEERMDALHLQMQNVVAAYLRHASLSPGTYQTPREGLNHLGAAHPRLSPPTQLDFQKFLTEIADARKAKEGWQIYSAISELYGAQ